MFFTEKDIRTAFDEWKELKALGHLHNLYNEVERQQPAIRAITLDEYKPKITKNEVWAVHDFICVVYLVYKNEYGFLPPINYNALTENLEHIKHIDTYNDYLTDCEFLEDYFKPIIHANEFIKPKNVSFCIAIVCAVISQFNNLIQKSN